MENDWPSGFPGINWLGRQEEDAVIDVVRKGALFRYYGPQAPAHVNQLEEHACAFYEVRYALAVNSGTGALCTAMSTLGIGPGDEVVVPAFLWVATVTAAIQTNAIPVLCEVDDSFSMDVFHLSEYGLHIYHNIRSLVEKIPLSPAGNPWSLMQNADSVYEYGKGTCPKSDDLFERSVIITVPSRLTTEQEYEMAQTIRTLSRT